MSEELRELEQRIADDPEDREAWRRLLHLRERAGERIDGQTLRDLAEVARVGPTGQWRDAAETLRRLGPLAAVGLAFDLESPYPGVRSEAAGALGQLGDAARPALPWLRDALGDSDPYVRDAALAVVVNIAPEDSGVAARLLQLVRDGDDHCRRWATRAMAELRRATGMRREQADAAALLGELCESEDMGLRRLAADSLSAFQEAAAPYEGQLRTLLEDSFYQARAAAVRSLGRIGRHVRLEDRTVTAMAALLADSQSAVLEAAEESLTRLAEVDERVAGPADEVLSSHADDPESRRRSWARRLRLRLQPELEAAREGLLAELERPEWAPVVAALNLVAQLGEQGVPYRELAAQRLGHHVSDVREAAVRALSVLPGGAEAARPVIDRLAASEDSRERARAVQFRAELLADAPDTVAIFRRSVAEDREATHWAVVDTVTRLGERALELEPELRLALEGPAWRLKCRAAEQLGEIGAREPETVAALAAMYEAERTIELRRASFRGLAGIDRPEARRAVARIACERPWILLDFHHAFEYLHGWSEAERAELAELDEHLIGLLRANRVSYWQRQVAATILLTHPSGRERYGAELLAMEIEDLESLLAHWDIQLEPGPAADVEGRSERDDPDSATEGEAAGLSG